MKKVISVLVLIVILGLAACAPPASAGEVKSDKRRDTSPEVSQSDLEALPVQFAEQVGISGRVFRQHEQCRSQVRLRDQLGQSANRPDAQVDVVDGLLSGLAVNRPANVNVGFHLSTHSQVFGQ